MIDIMAIRQSYERLELSEIRWINGNSKPAAAMTKSNANLALQALVSNNELSVKVQGWAQLVVLAVMLHSFCCFGLCRLDTQLEVTLRSLFISLQTSYTRTLFCIPFAIV